MVNCITIWSYSFIHEGEHHERRTIPPPHRRCPGLRFRCPGLGRQPLVPPLHRLHRPEPLPVCLHELVPDDDDSPQSRRPRHPQGGPPLGDRRVRVVLAAAAVSLLLASTSPAAPLTLR